MNVYIQDLTKQSWKTFRAYLKEEIEEVGHPFVLSRDDTRQDIFRTQIHGLNRLLLAYLDNADVITGKVTIICFNLGTANNLAYMATQYLKLYGRDGKIQIECYLVDNSFLL